MNYRQDIDGLRAISVLLVLFFHANIFGVSSGFVGVDVFFVISGYLITSGIKSGLEKDSFSFIDFFKRRLWRLQPVFIALIIMTLIMTTLTYLPEDYLNYTKSLRYSSAFLANHYFGTLNNGYFADDVGVMPLLHTWSLSVEWQWYLILPFLMMFFFKVIEIKKWLYWVLPLTLLMIVGIHFGSIAAQITDIDDKKALSFFFTEKGSLKYYYSFTGRIFEMLIGSSLAIIGSSKVNNIPKLLNSILGLCCIAIIIFIGVRNGTAENYPNKYALLVCLSAALLIYLGNAKNKGLATEILSIKPLVFVGLISYSLYIWHWPVFAFIRNLSIDETWLVTVSALFLSFVLAFLSYKYIETYFRKKHTTSFLKTLIILVIVPYLLIVLLDNQNRKNYGFTGRFGEAYTRINTLDNKFNYIEHRAENCNHSSGISKEIYYCFSENEKKKNILLFGDSFADHSFMFIKTLTDNANASLKMATAGGTPPLYGVYGYRGDGKNKESEDRYKFSLDVFNEIKDHQYDYVVLGGVWNRYFSVAANRYISNKITGNFSSDEAKITLEKSLEESVKKITEAKSIPVLLNTTYDISNANIYSLSKDPRGCVLRGIKLHSKINNCDFDENLSLDNDQIFLNNLFLKIKGEYPSVILLDMRSIQCQNGECKADINKYPVYRDKSGHITDYASYQFGKEYLEKYGNPFK